LVAPLFRGASRLYFGMNCSRRTAAPRELCLVSKATSLEAFQDHNEFERAVPLKAIVLMQQPKVTDYRKWRLRIRGSRFCFSLSRRYYFL
jgi:hypothetical protein